MDLASASVQDAEGRVERGVIGLAAVDELNATDVGRASVDEVTVVPSIHDNAVAPGVTSR